MSLLPVLLVLAAAITAAPAGSRRSLPNDPRQVPYEAQLTRTETRADLDGDGRAEVLVLVNALTGSDDPLAGTEVILGVYAPAAPDGDPGDLLWVRHVSRATGEPAHGGELTAVDLDGDGGSELILTWDRSPVAERVVRRAEVYAVDDPRSPRRVWEGTWEIDTRRDPRATPAETVWFRREIDFAATRRAAGRRLVLAKVQRVAAGLAVEPPAVEREAIDVRLRPASFSRR